MILLTKNDFERNISTDYISKDKIKEKIEEIHNEPLNYNPDDYWIENECKGYCIDKLQELLEERN